MYSRTESLTMTYHQEKFATSGMSARSTEPEVFTFERISAPVTAVPSVVPIRAKKRCTRVMYPAKVRMHLPPPEKNRAKRWLVILCLVVLWQIYSEDPCADAQLGSAECAISDYQSFSFSVENQARQMSELCPTSSELPHQEADEILPETSCLKPAQETDAFEQSAGKSYVAPSSRKSSGERWITMVKLKMELHALTCSCQESSLQ